MAFCGCWSGLILGRRAVPKKEEVGRFVWHGGLPMWVTDVTQGGLPHYCGMVTREEMVFGPLALLVETWPDYRIGSSHWPSGRLLARAIAEGALPGVLPCFAGRSVVELGAGPGLPSLVAAKMGAVDVVLTDLVELVPLAERNIFHNGLARVCRGEALDWLEAAQSALAWSRRQAQGPVDIVLAADVVYVEEQEPLMGALAALMAPGHTQLVLAYKNRNRGDREYLNSRILPRLEGLKAAIYRTKEDGETEIYVGWLRAHTS